jgi:hypothetical protein
VGVGEVFAGGTGGGLGEFDGLDGLGLGWRDGFVLEVEVTAAVVATADVFAVLEFEDDAEGDVHVAGGAGLMAKDGDAALAAGTEAVVVGEDGGRNQGAEGSDAFFGGGLDEFLKFEGLEFEEVFHQFRDIERFGFGWGVHIDSG